jgi:hypothetical protein
MQKLHEVLGDNMKDCDTCQVKLDEKLVDRNEVERKQEDQSVRIIETKPGEFKTLHRLQG